MLARAFFFGVIRSVLNFVLTQAIGAIVRWIISKGNFYAAVFGENSDRFIYIPTSVARMLKVKGTWIPCIYESMCRVSVPKIDKSLNGMESLEFEELLVQLRNHGCAYYNRVRAIRPKKWPEGFDFFGKFVDVMCGMQHFVIGDVVPGNVQYFYLYEQDGRKLYPFEPACLAERAVWTWMQGAGVPFHNEYGDAGENLRYSILHAVDRATVTVTPEASSTPADVIVQRAT